MSNGDLTFQKMHYRYRGCIKSTLLETEVPKLFSITPSIVCNGFFPSSGLFTSLRTTGMANQSRKARCRKFQFPNVIHRSTPRKFGHMVPKPVTQCGNPDGVVRSKAKNQFSSMVHLD
ncbi:hypothetical protein AVEN_106252-1 [Araneus ventricosus]|uniref:Uncharacterized protein n=1 Tax=Araneus ventricosus TaxID=182803 RepID=A0A4Y2WBR1_ARAVE|nr:hypothetical protein AVEN_106252-1 [Araneus ventricosus]